MAVRRAHHSRALRAYFAGALQLFQWTAAIAFISVTGPSNHAYLHC
jgi:hypothetical protein